MAVYKDKKRNTWFVAFRNTTKRGFNTKFEAQQYEAMMRLKSDDITVSLKFHDVIEDFANHKKARVSYATYIKIDNYINNHIIPQTTNKTMSRITKNDVRAFDDYVRGLKYATNTKRALMAYYKAIFKHAQMFFDLKSNPTIVLDIIDYTEKEQLKQINRSNNIWSKDEFNSFIKEVDKDDYNLLYNVLFHTGMRLGEALALSWDNYNGKELHVYKSITRKTDKGTFKVTTTKNKASIRNIVLSDDLILMLNQFYEKEKVFYGFKKEWFIFGRATPLPHTTINREKNKVCKKIGLKQIRLHDLRHSHASNLISSGVSIIAVSKRLGHSDITTTLNTYSHVLENDNIKLLKVLNE